MNATLNSPIATMADVLRQLGDIPPDRVRWNPRPGTATKDDLLKPWNARCELVDGTLVEKPMGQDESALAMWLGMRLYQHVLAHNLGLVSGEQGFFDLPGGPVRGPDVAFVSWDRMPNRERSRVPFPHAAPELVVEILSPSNTAAEMARKRREYFLAGVRVLWEIDPGTDTVTEYTADDAGRRLAPSDAIDGGSVLPGFRVPLADLFAELDRRG